MDTSEEADWCTATTTTVGHGFPKNKKLSPGANEWRARSNYRKYTSIKEGDKIRVTCKVCKRRMYAQIIPAEMCGGDEVLVQIPRHKRKGYWKKPRKKSRSAVCHRGRR